MSYTIDITVPGFSLANAKECVRAAAESYAPPAPGKTVIVITSPYDGTRVVITDCGNCVIVAVEGTKEIRQWITDAKAWRKRVGIYGVHEGFYQCALSLCQKVQDALQLFPGKPVIYCGHSLGGAVTQMTAWMVENTGSKIKAHSIYTFGSPRIGDGNAVSLYGALARRTFRITNGADIVPWLPGYLIGYRHTATEVFMSSIGGIITGPSIAVELVSDLPELIREYQRGHVALLSDHFIAGYIARLETI